MGSIIRLEQRYGKAIAAGPHEIVPVIDTIAIGLKAIPLRFIWMKPRAVRVRYSDGRVGTIAIPDPTRRIQIGLLLGALTLGCAMLLRRRTS